MHMCCMLQTVTTAARDAVHQVSQGMSAAGNAAASAAGAVVDKAKEVVQVRQHAYECWWAHLGGFWCEV